MCTVQDLNLQPSDLRSLAMPIELTVQLPVSQVNAALTCTFVRTKIGSMKCPVFNINFMKGRKLLIRVRCTTRKFYRTLRVRSKRLTRSIYRPGDKRHAADFPKCGREANWSSKTHCRKK